MSSAKEKVNEYVGRMEDPTRTSNVGERAKAKVRTKMAGMHQAVLQEPARRQPVEKVRAKEKARKGAKARGKVASMSTTAAFTAVTPNTG